MTDDIIKIKSITHLHQMLGCEKPLHPLISVIDLFKVDLPEALIGQKLTANFYCMNLKGGRCGMLYGRHHYDFEEGVLIFMGPNQVVAATRDIDPDDAGWMLFFHPDLIRTTPLGESIDDYTFFSYAAHEALHLSEQEREILNDCIARIRKEYEQRIDNHSHRVLVSNLELLLNYCARFYERQFNTRKAQNQDLLTQVELLLRNYYKSGQLAEQGLPSVQFLANQIHLSPNYLSDLLRKETGRSAKDHINDFLVEKAKTLLMSTNDTVSEIAFNLGFNYPHYFGRLFKTKTGLTPQQYRELN